MLEPRPIIGIMNALHDAMKAIEEDEPETALHQLRLAIVELEEHVPADELKRLNTDLNLQLTMAGSQLMNRLGH